MNNGRLCGGYMCTLPYSILRVLQNFVRSFTGLTARKAQPFFGHNSDRWITRYGSLPSIKIHLYLLASKCIHLHTEIRKRFEA